MPKLRISASSSPSSPSQVLSPNASTPTRVSSDLFEGDILVRIKDYNGESGDGVKRPEPEGHEYFIGDRDGKTWSILVRGRWKEEVDGDDILFGNQFEKPIRDHLPWGTSVALKFIKSWIDPTLEQDLYADRPWALSPLLSTTPFLNLSAGSASSLPSWDPSSLAPKPERSAAALKEMVSRSKNEADDEDEEEEDDGLPEEGEWTVAQRKAWTAVKENRKKIRVGKQDIVEFDFAQSFLNFKDLSVTIPAVNYHVNLLQYWEGSPVTFVCRNRSGTQVYFSITFEIVELEEGEETGTGVKPAPRELTPNAGQKEGGMPGGFGDEEETPDEID